MPRYIGARYVPVFYENSQDGSTQWEPNVVYEPMVWVTLQNGHMYLSKKKVPATVGSPADNIAYWLDAANYNGYIQDLDNRVSQLENDTAGWGQDISDLQSGVTLINTTITNVVNDLLNNGVMLEETANVITVDANTSLRDAIDSIQSGDITFIFVPTGNYDMATLFPQADFNIGCVVPENTYIIGVGRKNSVQLGVNFATQDNDYSVFNTKGNCGLFNMHLYGNKCRYTLHDDTAVGGNITHTHIFKDCKFSINDPFYHTVGGGIHYSDHVIFENCIFDCAGGMDSVYYHGSNEEGNAKLEFIGCKFLSMGSDWQGDFRISTGNQAVHNNIELLFHATSCGSIIMNEATYASDVSINMDTDIPVLWTYDYKNLAAPRMVHCQVENGAFTRGYVVHRANNNYRYVTNMGNNTGMPLGVAAYVDGVRGGYIRMGSETSCPELGLTTPSGSDSQYPIYVSSSGQLTFSNSGKVIGVARKDSTATLYDKIF